MDYYLERSNDEVSSGKRLAPASVLNDLIMLNDFPVFEALSALLGSRLEYFTRVGKIIISWLSMLSGPYL